jgi:hypothetical protein
MEDYPPVLLHVDQLFVNLVQSRTPFNFIFSSLLFYILSFSPDWLLDLPSLIVQQPKESGSIQLRLGHETCCLDRQQCILS